MFRRYDKRKLNDGSDTLVSFLTEFIYFACDDCINVKMCRGLAKPECKRYHSINDIRIEDIGHLITAKRM